MDTHSHDHDSDGSCGCDDCSRGDACPCEAGSGAGNADERALEELLADLRARTPAALRPHMERFIATRRAELLTMVRAGSATPAREAAPADLVTPKARTAANIAALRCLAGLRGRAPTAEERQALMKYSDWGGLSIDNIREPLPKGLSPEPWSLLHGYYTPTLVADAIGAAICPLLAGLAGRDGVVRALEPSVGSGRFLRAVAPARCREADVTIAWTTIELSKPSARIVRALHPDAEHHAMAFESWVQEHAADVRGRLHLVVCNPPYGERGALIDEDPERDYRERTAYAYFMRRALDLLVPGGLGVFVVPSGFLTGAVNRALRERILKRHHLAAAFRLPSKTSAGRNLFSGAGIVADVLFWRSRGGELPRVDRDDAFIVDGKYFDEHPTHVLGQPEGEASGEDDTAGDGPAYRYAVIGDFEGLPPLRERPMCEACTAVPAPRKSKSASIVRNLEAVPKDLPDDQRHMLHLGRRVSHYLALRGKDDDRAVQLWPELRTALQDFARAVGNPRRADELRALAEDRDLAAAQQLRSAFDESGALVPALRRAPVLAPKFAGQTDDILGQAEMLFRRQRYLTIETITRFHAAIGGKLSQETILERLLAAGWNLDGEAWEALAPSGAYLTGVDLWAKYDRAERRAQQGDAQAAVQAARLIETIAPAVFDDLDDISPSDGYVPLDLLSTFVRIAIQNGPITLEHAWGHIKADGKLRAETQQFLGWLNHDWSLFKPERHSPTDSEDIWERRQAKIDVWTSDFRKFLAADPNRQQQVVDAYNRAHRGRITPTYSTEPLEIARWSDAVSLRPHQVAGSRRLLAQLGGILAFDVGVGKTYTALAALAAARQEGAARRPVVLAPSSLVWKWYDDFAQVLPDYRVLVIGSKRHRVSRGDRKGVLSSEPDTPEERAQKWMALQAGQADAVILSYDALALTRMNEAAIVESTEKIEAIRRLIAIEKFANRARIRRFSERDEQALTATTAQWVRTTLALPRGREYDPGIAWDDIGVDLLIVDEAASFKNLFMPSPRLGAVPLYMGASTDGAQRAWQLYFRADAVRRRTGGSGVMLLTATPMKNSPLELYNLLQFVEPRAFTTAGIHDPEQFVNRFLRIERIPVVNASFRPVEKPACVGFKHLDDLHTIIATFLEFRSAKDAGIELPTAIVERIPVEMNEAQEAKYVRCLTDLEDALKSGRRADANLLGLLARLSLIAIHPGLDDGYDFRTALAGGVAEMDVVSHDRERWKGKGWVEIGEGEDEGTIAMRRTLGTPDYGSPKLTRCAELVAASPGCGHIIFCEPTAAHQWIREVLVAHGIPRERIAILNAEITSGQDRVRIAREFNGLSAELGQDAPDEARYDVVIANSVAYEGIDLQVRTCAIHHIDLPWTPADLEQRNGRGVRQGNTLGTIRIYYYLAERSSDAYRYSIILGKAQWMGEVLAASVRDTNNPAAQQRMSADEILLMISRDPEGTRTMLEENARRDALVARRKSAASASRLLRQANARFREARAVTDPARAARLREEGEARLTALSALDPNVWPWTPWMYAVRDTELLVPEDGGAPLFEGLRVVRRRPGKQVQAFEFGAVAHGTGGARIGRREAGSPVWTPVTDESDLAPEDLLQDAAAWPGDDDAHTEAAIQRHIAETVRPATTYASLGWTSASETWFGRWWPRFQADIAKALSRSQSPLLFPVVVRGALALRRQTAMTEGELLPPSRAGFARFVALAPRSGLALTELRMVAKQWWQRSVPSDLLSRPVDPDPSSVPETVEALPAARPPSPMTPAWHDPDAEEDFVEADIKFEALVDQLRRRIAGMGVPESALIGSALSLAGDLQARLSEPREIESLLIAEGFRHAGDELSQVRQRATPELMAAIWFHIRERLQLAPVRGTPGDLIVPEGHLGMMQGQPCVCRPDLFTSAYPFVSVTVERRDPEGVHVRPIGADRLRVGDATCDLVRHPIARIESIWLKLRALEEDLRRAPLHLDNLRNVLLLSAALIASPNCQGERRTAAIAALRQARAYYRNASTLFEEHRPATALTRLAKGAARVAELTAKLAEDCHTDGSKS